ncbi:TPA: hypothetical protein ACN36P_003884 [Vibrio parahaemolyticus]
MGWAERFGRKKAVPKVVDKKLSDIDIGLSRISRDLALSDLHLDKLYRPILERVSVILNDAEARDKFNDIIDVLAEMLRFRRGVTLPENIEAEQVQRYREICNYTLFLVVLAKTMAEFHSRSSVQFDANGEIRNYPPLFTFAMSNESKRIGVTRAANDVIGNGVDEGLAIMQIADFFKVVPNAVVWFSSFPDMLKILFSLCLGTRRGQFSEITEKYASLAIGRCFGTGTVSVAATVSTIEAPKPTPKVGTLFQNNSSSPENGSSLATAQQPELKSTTSASAESLSTAETTGRPTEPSTINPALSDLLSSITSASSNAPKSNGEVEGSSPSDTENKQESSEYELKRFHTLMVEQHLELKRWVFRDTGEDVIAIPARLYRELCSSLYRHLSGQKKSDAEKAFMKVITPHLRGPVHKDVIGPQTTVSGERMMLITADFYHLYDGPNIVEFIS